MGQKDIPNTLNNKTSVEKATKMTVQQNNKLRKKLVKFIFFIIKTFVKMIAKK